MGMLKMELDDPAGIRLRRRPRQTRGEATPTSVSTPPGRRRVRVTTLDARPRLAGGI